MSEKFKKAQPISIELDEVHEAEAAAAASGQEADPEANPEEEGVDVQQGITTIDADVNVPAVGAGAAIPQQSFQEEIKSTDIVFACSSCGSSLAIDYRGAGLEINCTQCGAPTLVPIPAGMEVSDLDLSPGELLVQLFQARNTVHKRDQHIAELTKVIESLKARRGELERARMNSLHRNAELAHMCQQISRAQAEITATLSRMLTLIAEEQQL